MPRGYCCYLFTALLLLVAYASAATPEQWATRTVYQLLTDRFALEYGDFQPCANISTYCGGLFAGVQSRLDYITSMGFDAIWISPIPLNTPSGYHGYWALDLTQVNPYFGTEQDLINLINACHQRGMYVMLDVVANHMGPVGFNYSEVVPFNNANDYHACLSVCSQCNIGNYQCFLEEMLDCRTSGLPDLNQTVPYVRQYLVDWVAKVVSKFSFDGLRIDTVPEIEPSFWAEYQQSAGVYAVGEVWADVQCVGNYSHYLDGVLSYPMFTTLRNIFQNGASLNNIDALRSQYATNLKNVSLAGVFLDNHDNPRFLNQSGVTMNAYMSGLVYVLMSEGIPIIYYGTEQGFHGGNDPYCREPLWPSLYSTTSPLYTFLQTVVNYRKTAQVWNYPQVTRYTNDNIFYAWTRGTSFIAVTNQSQNIMRTIKNHPYANGQKLCNLFYPTQDCLVVENGSFPVYLNGGEVKIFYPVN